MTASAIVAAVGGGRQCQSARYFAAWLGLKLGSERAEARSILDGSARVAVAICARS